MKAAARPDFDRRVVRRSHCRRSIGRLGLSGDAAAGTTRQHGGEIGAGQHAQYTQAQIDDPFNPPDWFPDEHPPMPQVVAHGGPKPAGRACAQCHLPSGDGHPESASLAGLPAGYIIRQMERFQTGIRNNRAPAS